jgi:hypothetical protein
MVRRAVELGKQWALDGADMRLPQLAEFLVSHEGLDFHSDESDGEGSLANAHPAQLQQLVGLQPVGHIEEEPNKTSGVVRRIVMTHAFRSELAAHLILELDRDASVHRTMSPRVGAPLSARMAHALLQRPDLTPLIDQDQVAAVAESKKRKGPWPLDVEDDSVQPMNQMDDSTSLVSDQARSSRQAARGGAHRRCSPMHWHCMYEPLETAASGSKRVGMLSAATARAAPIMRHDAVSYTPAPHKSQRDACSLLTCPTSPLLLFAIRMSSTAWQLLLPPQPPWSWTTTKSCGSRRRQQPSQPAAVPKELSRRKRISSSSGCWRSSSGAWRRSKPSSQHRRRRRSSSSSESRPAR